MAYVDRRQAGRALGERLAALEGRDDVVVLAVPRGGVPVGYEVAVRLGAPLDVLDEAFRIGRPALDVAGKLVILVDDGVATGATMRAAARAVRPLGAAAIVAATPVGAAGACERVLGEADRVVCAITAGRLRAIGDWYDDFEPPTDDEIRRLLAAARRARRPPLAPATGPAP